jgi:hypothetical protein
MARWDITGSCSGEYSYDSHHSLPGVPSSVSFTLSAHQGWFGRFKGVVRDDPTSGLAEEASVRGRVAGTRLTFWKRYPVLYVYFEGKLAAIDEQLRAQHGIKLDRNILPAPIRYCGEYDPVDGAVRGTWEVRPHRIRFRKGGVFWRFPS